MLNVIGAVAQMGSGLYGYQNAAKIAGVIIGAFILGLAFLSYKGWITAEYYTVMSFIDLIEFLYGLIAYNIHRLTKEIDYKSCPIIHVKPLPLRGECVTNSFLCLFTNVGTVDQDKNYLVNIIES